MENETSTDPTPSGPQRPSAWVWAVVVYAWLQFPMCTAAAGSSRGYGALGLALVAMWFVVALISLRYLYLFVARSESGRLLPGVLTLVGSIASFFGVYSSFSFFPGPRGRQLLHKGKPVTPRRRRVLALEEGTHEQAAARGWAANGDTEWVSVAAFSKLSLDLLSLGAPMRLVQSCHDDALDEVRHAQACWDLARQLGGPVQAGEVPLPDVARLRLATTPAMVAVESYVQGAYLERVSADLAQELVPRTGDARVASVLRRIEEDERRHSEHGWEIVEWCLSIDEIPVRKALEAVRFGAPVHATTGANLTRWGLADPDLVAAVDVRVRREVEARLTALLAPADRRRASGARA